MNFFSDKTERPALISLICILGFFGAAMSVYWLMTAPDKLGEPWFYYYNFVAVLFTLLFLIGIWKMRKWGANGFAVLAILNIIVLVFSNHEFVFSILVAGIFIFVLLANYSRMT